MQGITRHRRDSGAAGRSPGSPRRRTSRPLAALTVGSVVAVIGATVIIGTTQSSAASAPQWQTLTAAPAASFVDSIGVNVHCTYTDTTYANSAGVLASLQELGVRNVRDGIKPDNVPAVACWELLRDNGVKASMIVDPAGRFGSGTLAEQTAALVRLGGFVATVEGPNEVDCTGDGWLERVRSQQAELAQALEASSQLRDLPLLGPSWCRYGSIKEYGADGARSDAVNLHPYAGGDVPGSVAGQFTHAREVNPGKPLFATEAGYHNAVNGDGYGHVPTSEAATAPYMVRTFLENYRLGVSRTFVYELQNQRDEPALLDSESHFGLVRADGSRTPAFLALKNMITTLADTGAAPPQRELRVGLSDAPADIRTLALGRSDGSTDLVLWREAAVWDRSAKRDLTVAAAPVGLSLETASSASVVSPVTGTQRTALGTGTSFSVDVGASPVIVRLAATATPSGGAVTGTPTEAPSATTEAPSATTPAPSVTTEAPSATTSAPSSTTAAPSATTEASTITAPATTSATPTAAVTTAPATQPTTTAAPTPPSPAGGVSVPTRVMNVGDVLRLDVGATGAVRSGSRAWVAEEGFTGGTTGRARQPVAMTSYPEVYSTYRWGVEAFAMNLPNGRYRVNLLMAEDAFNGAQQRVFSVTGEGRPVLTDMDLFEVAGMNTGVWRTFVVEVDDGQLDLDFSADVDNAILSGMVIQRRS